MFQECYFDLAMGFCPSQQVFQSCRDETTDSWMLRSSVEEIKVPSVFFLAYNFKLVVIFQTSTIFIKIMKIKLR